MSIETHGLYIGIERCGSDIYLALIAKGKLTHEDYKNITPMIDSALESVTHPQVTALIDLRELQGWEARAAWDDFKIGLKHGNEFVNVAICGSKKWQKVATKVGTWFVSGTVKYFDSREEAASWLIQQGQK